MKLLEGVRIAATFRALLLAASLRDDCIVVCLLTRRPVQPRAVQYPVPEDLRAVERIYIYSVTRSR